MGESPAETSKVDPSGASTLIYLSRSVWLYWRPIALFTCLMMLIALVDALLATPVYRATLVASPVSQSSSLLGGKLGSLSSLADAAGVGSAMQGQGQGPTPDEIMAVLQSRQVTMAFFRKHQVLRVLFSDDWDAEKHTWYPPDFLARTAAWLEGNPPPTGGPSERQAFMVFDKIRRADYDLDTGIITVSVEWKDPAIASDWANELVAAVDDAFRQKAQLDSQRGLAFLEVQARQASLADLRDAIFTAATSEITTAMDASVRTNYAIKVLDPAIPPLERGWPKRTFILSLGLVAGLFFGSIGAITWVYIRDLVGLATAEKKTADSAGGTERTSTPADHNGGERVDVAILAHSAIHDPA